MTTKQKILVKQAEMRALHNKYIAAMRVGEAYIQKLASAEARKQAMYRKVVAGIKGLGKEAQYAKVRGAGNTYYEGDLRATPDALKQMQRMKARGQKVSPQYMALIKRLAAEQQAKQNQGR